MISFSKTIYRMIHKKPEIIIYAFCFIGFILLLNVIIQRPSKHLIPKINASKYNKLKSTTNNKSNQNSQTDSATSFADKEIVNLNSKTAKNFEKNNIIDNSESNNHVIDNNESKNKIAKSLTNNVGKDKNNSENKNKFASQNATKPKLKPEQKNKINNNIRLKKYQIKKGDSLWEIALVYKISIKTIIQYNEIDNPDYIIAGKTIKLPVSSTDNKKLSRKQKIVNKSQASQKTNSKTLKVAKLKKNSKLQLQTKKKISSSYLTYRIQKGDSLWKIAKNFSITLETLLNNNKLANPNVIIAGQTLNIHPIKPEKKAPKQKSSPKYPNKKRLKKSKSKLIIALYSGISLMNDNYFYASNQESSQSILSANKFHLIRPKPNPFRNTTFAILKKVNCNNYQFKQVYLYNKSSDLFSINKVIDDKKIIPKSSIFL